MKKKQRTFLTNVNKTNENIKNVSQFVQEKALNLKGELLPNHVSLHCKHSPKTRSMVMAILNPAIWLDFYLFGKHRPLKQA